MCESRGSGGVKGGSLHARLSRNDTLERCEIRNRFSATPFVRAHAENTERNGKE